MDFTNQSACPFCNSDKSKIILANDLAMAIYDDHPVTCVIRTMPTGIPL
jgi:hypothetical protein